MTLAQAREIGEKLIRKADEAQARSVTTRINPPLSPAEREQRYRQVLRELRDPKFYQIRITGMLLKRGYLLHSGKRTRNLENVGRRWPVVHATSRFSRLWIDLFGH
jgi:hypothetical protein